MASQPVGTVGAGGAADILCLDEHFFFVWFGGVGQT